MSKKPDIEKSNKQNVERLLKELSYDSGSIYRTGEGWDKFHQLNDELQRLKEKLHDVPEVRKLEKQIECERERCNERSEAIKNKVAKVRRAYYAKGLTPAVLKQLETLVDELNNDKT